MDYPETFEYAWLRYCVYASPAKVSRHNLPCQNLRVDPEKLADFEREIKRYFADSAKGEECHIRFYDEVEQAMLLVERGSYFRTLAHWEGRTDDKEQYIRLFARIFIGNLSLAECPDRDRVYILDPILNNSFSWAGWVSPLRAAYGYPHRRAVLGHRRR